MNKRIKQIIKLFLLILIFALLLAYTPFWESFLKWLFPEAKKLIFPRSSYVKLFFEHLLMVVLSSGLSAIIGVSIGIFVTRRIGKDFLHLTNSLVSLGQTIPPIAVLAIALPLVGFGLQPTLIALFVYGLLPVVRNTIAGIEAVSDSVKEAAKGMGMTGKQVLFRVELPIASKVIMTGIRTSVVINIGTATLGATVGAGGFGSPIMAGLTNDLPAYIMHGAIIVAFFAIIIDGLLDFAEKLYKRAI